MKSKLDNKYEKIVIPDRKLEDIKKTFGDLSQKWLQILIDYLNRDKYLLTQSILKTINKDNFKEISIYLDWALSRIDWLIVTLSKYIKEDNKRWDYF